jgi:predicted nucleic acid-binding protein
MANGMDFTDAIHLAKAESCAAFLSFDRKLRKAVSSYSTTPVEAP